MQAWRFPVQSRSVELDRARRIVGIVYRVAAASLFFAGGQSILKKHSTKYSY
jgi:hypothetical protein